MSFAKELENIYKCFKTNEEIQKVLKEQDDVKRFSEEFPELISKIRSDITQAASSGNLSMLFDFEPNLDNNQFRLLCKYFDGELEIHNEAGIFYFDKVNCIPKAQISWKR
jgi:hypothetical protein